MQPGARESECIQIVGDVQNPRHQRRPTALQALAPIKVLGSEIAVVEWRLLQADVADLAEREIKRRRVPIGVAMLEFPDQRASTLIDQVQRAVDPCDTAGAGIVGEGLAGRQQHTGVVHA